MAVNPGGGTGNQGSLTGAGVTPSGLGFDPPKQGSQTTQTDPKSKSIASGTQAPGSVDPKSAVKETKGKASQEPHHPQVLDILQKVQDVKALQNPTALAAMGGAGSLSTFLSQIASMLSLLSSNNQNKKKANNAANSVIVEVNTVETPAIDCSDANRPNLSPDEIAWCDLLLDEGILPPDATTDARLPYLGVVPNLPPSSPVAPVGSIGAPIAPPLPSLPATITYRSTAQTTSASATTLFPNMATGTGNVVMAVIISHVDITITSVRIGTTPMILAANTSANVGKNGWIYLSDNPTGLQTLTVLCDATNDAMAATICDISNLRSKIPIDTGSSANANPATVEIIGAAGGIIVGGGNPGTSSNATYSAELTKVADGLLNQAGNHRHYSVGIGQTAATANLNPTITWSSSANSRFGFFASFR